MPINGIDVTASDITSQVVRNKNGQSVLDFYVEEYLGNKEPNSFDWKFVTTPPIPISPTRLPSLTKICVTNFTPAIHKTKKFQEMNQRHFFLSSLNQSHTNTQQINLPWQTSPTGKTNHSPKGATPRPNGLGLVVMLD